jgi:sucrose-6-phosphate hydrolase SacC (GH32 family)
MALAPRIGVLPANARAAIPTEAHPLPSRLPVVTSAASGQRLLAADSADALFYSANAGKSWKLVKSIWPGNVTQLATLAESPNSGDVFQLTTQSGSVWLSRDGLHWRQATPQH